MAADKYMHKPNPCIGIQFLIDNRQKASSYALGLRNTTV